MAATVSTAPIGFRSHDGTSQIRGLIWAPERPAGTRARAARRRADRARHVRAPGALRRVRALPRGPRLHVCARATTWATAKSAPRPARSCGCLPAARRQGRPHRGRPRAAPARWPRRYSRQTPYILFGHSMGSFVVRAYLARHAEGLAAAVLCGTGNPAACAVEGGQLPRAPHCGVEGGATAGARFLDGHGRRRLRQADRERRARRFDWLSTDPDVVDAYIADEMCGAMFSAGGYATLTDLTGEVVTRACAAKVPHDLPVLFVAGAEDPVGGCGKGVHAAAELLRGAGVRRVDEVLYPGMRHEILNEPGRAQVYADIAQWMEEARMRKAYVIALDQGTTSSRAMLVDARRARRRLRCSTRSRRSTRSRAGWSTTRWTFCPPSWARSPSSWCRTGCGPAEIDAIGITNQRETTIVWDRETGAPGLQRHRVAVPPHGAASCERARERRGTRPTHRATRTGLVPDAYFSGHQDQMDPGQRAGRARPGRGGRAAVRHRGQLARSGS